MTQRESMEFDIVIVGAGPAGLATACRIRQLCQQQSLDYSVCLVEKGAEIGAHILSGAVIEGSALDELFPDWKELDAPLTTPVTSDELHFLLNAEKSIKIPAFLLPKALHNRGNYVASLGNLCRWLGKQAENLGVEIFTGFTAAEILFDESGKVSGIATGDLGLNKDSQEKGSFEAGYELRGKFTVFAEGCRGHLGKELINRFTLDKDSTPQHYGLGIKEIWEISPEKHDPGKVVHSLGWPLGFGKTGGGSFLYHLDNNQVVVGLITDLNYENTWLNPFQEFQQLKHHPLFKDILTDGKRIAYGARALVKGGLQSLPQLTFPGGILVGDEAGFLNFLKLKGSHTAIKSGVLAADCLVGALTKGAETPERLDSYQEAFEHSSIHQELYHSRNSAPAFHKFGTLLGALFSFFDQAIFQGKLPFTLRDTVPDHARLKPAEKSPKLEYPKPDNTISFDILSSVFLSNTHHEEDQPCHLKLANPDIPLQFNLSEYDEPAQRYCPAGVYEVIRNEEEPSFLINAQNCIHCKTCDIKDPCQNITWHTPEGGGGPNYPNM